MQDRELYYRKGLSCQLPPVLQQREEIQSLNEKVRRLKLSKEPAKSNPLF